MGKKSGSSAEQVSTLTGGQQQLLNKLTDLLGSQIGSGIQPYSGDTVAGASPLQQQGFSFYDKLMPTAQEGADVFSKSLAGFDTGQGSDILKQGQNALKSSLENWDPSSAMQFWNEAIKTPAMQTWQRDIVPQLTEKYASRNATNSGAFDRALARSAQDLTTGLNSQLASVLYQGEQAHKDRQQTGVNQSMQMAMMPGELVNQAGGIANQGMNIANMGMNAGDVQRQIEQQGLSSDYQSWQVGQGYNNPWLQYLGTALGTPAFDTVVSQDQGWASALMPALGSFAGSTAGSEWLADSWLGKLFGQGT